jgi:hypothetical protein
LTLPSGHQLFIVVKVLRKWVWVADYYQYCSGESKENVYLAGYRVHLQVLKKLSEIVDYNQLKGCITLPVVTSYSPLMATPMDMAAARIP